MVRLSISIGLDERQLPHMPLQPWEHSYIIRQCSHRIHLDIIITRMKSVITLAALVKFIPLLVLFYCNKMHSIHIEPVMS